jgi:TonB family protein
MNARRGCAVLVLMAALFRSTPATATDVKVVTPKELWALFEVKRSPVYPYEARRARITGSGIFRIYANPDGTIRTVAVMKSTGSKILDLAAAGGLYQSKLKASNKRREIDMPVTFTMTR